MAKYAPLGVFLKRWKRKNLDAETIELSFADIERIIGAMLPHGAVTDDWWGNEPGKDRGSVQCHAWLDAGFEAFLVDGSERVRFCKLGH